MNRRATVFAFPVDVAPEEEKCCAAYASRSLFLFDESHVVRRTCRRITASRQFQIFILTAIILNSAALAVEQPTYTLPSDAALVLLIFEYIFTIIFVLEMMIKVVGMGFVLGKRSYLRDGWNVMDFLIVVVSIVSLTGSIDNISAVRVFRVLRPLRSINNIKALKHLMVGLFRAVPMVVDNLLFLAFIMIVFAVLAIQLWAGDFHRRCYYLPPNATDPVLIASETRRCGGTFECSGEDVHCLINRAFFEQKHINFDNFGSAMLLVFKVISLDDWVEDFQASLNANGRPTIIFYVALTMFGSYFCINLFLAILTKEYAGLGDPAPSNPPTAQPSRRATMNLLCDKSTQVDFDDPENRSPPPETVSFREQKPDNGAFNPFAPNGADGDVTIDGIMISTQTTLVLSETSSENNEVVLDSVQDFDHVRQALQMEDIDPTGDVTGDPEAMQNERRRRHVETLASRCYARVLVGNIVHNRVVEFIILAATFVNVVCLAVDHYGIDRDLEFALDVIGITCTCLFALEIAGKIFAFGPRVLRNGFNLFDLVLVLIAIPDIVWQNGSSGFSAFRAFRMLRVLRLMRRLESLRMIIEMVVHSMRSATYLSLLIVLFLYVFAVMGMQLFGTAYNPVQTEDLRDSFGTIWESALTCFIVITGESWNKRMKLGMDVNPVVGAVYFLLLYMIGKYILINLFIAIIMDSFGEKMQEQQEREQDRPPTLILPVYRPIVGKKIDFSTLVASIGKHSMGFVVGGDDRVFADVDNSVTWFTVFEQTVRKALRSYRMQVDGYSLFMFSKRHPLRKLCVYIVESMWFNIFTAVAMVANVAFMAFDSPSLDGTAKDAQVIADVVFCAIFLFEMVVKIIAMGAVLVPQREDGTKSSEKPYFRDPWNVVDAIVAIISLVALFVDELKFLRSLRTFRLVVRSESTRIILVTVVQSIPPVIQGVGFSLFLFLIFGILGVQLLKGKMYRCTDPDIYEPWRCVGNYTTVEAGPLGVLENVTVDNEWKRLPFHFDHMGGAMLTLFEVAVGDGWAVIMYAGLDASESGMGLRHNYSPYMALYFVVFYVAANFFAVNMIVGILINYFSILKRENDGTALLSDEQRRYTKAQRAIASALLDEALQPPNNRFSQWMFAVISYRRNGQDTQSMSVFELLVTIAICLNTVQLSMFHYGMDAELERALMFVGIFFTAAFTLEAFMKISALGPKGYFSVPWNRFDFVIVLSSYGTYINIVGGASAIRVLRVVRVVRLVKQAKGLQKLLTTIFESAGALANVFALLILVFFVFAVTGVSLFGKVKKNGDLNDDFNFDNVPNALLVLYYSASTEGWNSMMRACSIEPPHCEGDQCGNESVAIAYFVLFMLVGSFTVLQLFVAVVVEVFSETADFSDDPVMTSLMEMKVLWVERFGEGAMYIPWRDFINVLPEFPSFLTGLSANPTRGEMIRVLSNITLPVMSNFTVGFRDVINAFTWWHYNINASNLHVASKVLDNFHNFVSISRSYSVAQVYAVDHIAGVWMRRRAVLLDSTYESCDPNDFSGMQAGNTAPNSDGEAPVSTCRP